jgi:hypothetical protein
MSHDENDIPLLVSRFDIAMGFGNLLQRESSVDNWLQPPRFD